MSRPIDEKIVSMRLDNRDFETNAKKSMQTFIDLNSKMGTASKVDFNKAASGVKTLSDNAGRSNSVMGNMANSIKTIADRFSTLGVIGTTALMNITNKVTNFALNMGKKLTIQPIMDGFREYETKMKSIQTILANTKHQGTTLDEVKDKMGELNTYADKTIYNFAEMTHNLGLFTNAGLGLDKSTYMIKGFMNTAAAAGSTNEAAQRGAYQLSQALSVGVVKLMDWRSLTNAGMGGATMKTSLIEIAQQMGTLNKGTETASFTQKNFNETLKDGWLTSEVMAKYLKIMAGEVTEADLVAQGFSKKRAREMLQQAKDAEEAATKVRTFSQLIDTTQESIGSVWGSIFQTLIGDFNEATDRLTSISKVINDFIDGTLGAAARRFEEFGKLGGIDAIWKTLGNILRPIGQVIGIISRAFASMFPPVLVSSSVQFFKALESITAKLTLSEGLVKGLETALKLLLIPFSIGWKVIKGFGKILVDAFTLVSGALPKANGGISNFFSNLGKGIPIAETVTKVSKFILDNLRKLAMFVAGGLSIALGFLSENIMKIANAVRNYDPFGKLTKGAKLLYDAIKDSGIFQNLSNGIRNLYDVVVSYNPFGKLKDGYNSIKTWLNANIFSRFIGNVKAAGDTVDKINPMTKLNDHAKKAMGAIDKLKEAFNNFMNSPFVKAVSGFFKGLAKEIGDFFGDTTANDAVSGGILYLILKVIKEVGNIIKNFSTTFAGFQGMLDAISTKIPQLLGGLQESLVTFTKAVQATALKAIAVAIAILAAALFVMSKIEWEPLARGLTGLAGVMVILTVAMKQLDKVDLKDLKAGKFLVSVVTIGIGIILLSSALAKISKLDTSKLASNTTIMVLAIATLAGVLDTVDTADDKFKKSSKAVLTMAAAMGTLAIAMRIIAKIDAVGLAKATVVIAAFMTGMVLMNNAMKSGSGLGDASTSFVKLAIALNLLIIPIAILGKFDVGHLVKAVGTLAVLGGGLVLFANSTKAIDKGTGLRMMGIATALNLLIIPITILGALPWAVVAQGLGGLALTIGIFVAAAWLLFPVQSALFVLGKAMLGVGVGMGAFGVGLGLAISALEKIINFPSKIITAIKTLVIGLVEAFAEVVPALTNALIRMLLAMMKGLMDNAALMADTLMKFLIKVIEIAAKYAGPLIDALAKLADAIIKAFVKVFNDLDSEQFLKAIAAVGAIAVLAKLLAGLTSLLPQAMLGVLSAGVLLAELALVLAAIGALNKIPGLKDFVDSGAELLAAVASAIGGFIGNFIGAIAEGIVSKMPKIGQDLSTFMTNLKPFLDGAKGIKPGSLDGVKEIAGVVIALTAASIIDGLTRWITGGSNLVAFGEQLALFGPKLKSYSDSVSGINPNLIMASAIAAGSLAEFAKKLPKEGGLVGLITGGNDIVKFGEQLALFGPKLMAYNISIAGISPNLIVASSWAAGAMSKFAENLPKKGGLVGLITGDNDIVKFGDQLALFGPKLQSYSTSIANINPDLINKSSTAAISLTKFADAIPKKGGLVGLITGDNDIVKFGEQLALFGPYLSSYSKAVTGVQVDPIAISVTAGKKLVELVEAIPSSGGIASWFTGDVGIDDFGARIVKFGGYLTRYAALVVGIDTEAVANSATAAYKLAELAKAIPNNGGMMTWFTGDNTIDDFGYRIVKFGEYLKQYAAKIVGIDSESIANSGTAAYKLAELEKAIPNSGGMMTWFTGDNTIDDFGARIVTFGEYLKQYSEEVAGIELSHITNATKAAKDLAGIQEALPVNGGLKSFFTGDNSIAKFGKAIVSFGKQLVDFSDIAANVSPTNVAAALEAAENILKTLRTIKNVSVDSITAFKKAVDELGKVSIDKLVDAFEDGEAKVKTAIDGVINVMKTTFAAANKPMTDAGTEHVSKYIGGLNSKPFSIFIVGAALAGKAKEGLGSVSSSSVGSNFVQGFINKMGVRGTDVWNAAYKLAGKALAGMEKRLKVKSPSRAAGEIGNFTVLGFVNRLIAGGKSVYDSGVEIGSRALEGIKKTTTGLADLVNERMELNPIIKPVMDFDNIADWNPQTPVFAGAGVGAISPFSSNITLAQSVAARPFLETTPQVVQNDYKTEVNNTGLLDGAVFHVREEADVPKIAREIVKLENDELLRRGYRP